MSELAELLTEYETPFYELTEEEWKEYYSSTCVIEMNFKINGLILYLPVYRKFWIMN